MSGKDERVQKRPQCPRCELRADIILRYSNRVTAGWILKERDRNRFGVPILVSGRFKFNLIPIEAVCGVCGFSNVDIVDKALVFFKKEVQAGNYITWSEWKVLRHER